MRPHEIAVDQVDEPRVLLVAPAAPEPPKAAPPAPEPLEVVAGAVVPTPAVPPAPTLASQLVTALEKLPTQCSVKS